MMVCEELMSFWKIINSSFVSQVAGTALGAIFAFFFGLKLYRYQRIEEHKITLLFFISSLTSISSSLYALKEQIVQHRYNECIKCKNTISASDTQRLQIKEMSKYIYSAHPEWPILFDRLEFLALADPNLIILSGTLKNSLATLDSIITDINSDTSRFVQGTALNTNDILMMIRKNELLYEQLDSALYLNNLLSDVLIKYGHSQFKKEMKIKSVELMDDKYKNLVPKPIESWEGYDWFPKKKKWWRFWQ